MPFIDVPYIILEIGYTKNLKTDRISNPDIFNDWDEDLIEEMSDYECYYKVKYPKYPKCGIDIDRLCEWANENRYVSDATMDEKNVIKWDGTKEHLLEKIKISRSGVFLRKRLIQWVKKRQKYNESGLLTEDSPIIPNLTIFHKIIEYGPDIYDWIFPCELENTNIYNYKRIWDIDSITLHNIEPTIINDQIN